MSDKKTAPEFLAMSEDDYAQAVLDSEALNCHGCDGGRQGCTSDCELQKALVCRWSTIPIRRAGRAAQLYINSRRTDRELT